MKKFGILLAAMLFAAGAWAQGSHHPPEVPASAVYTCEASKEGRLLAITNAVSRTDCTMGGGGDVTASCQCIEDGTFAWRATDTSTAYWLDPVDVIGSAPTCASPIYGASIKTYDTGLGADPPGDYICKNTGWTVMPVADHVSQHHWAALGANPDELNLEQAATACAGGQGFVAHGSGDGSVICATLVASTGTGLQYGDGAGSLSEVTGSSVSGADVALGGDLTLPSGAIDIFHTATVPGEHGLQIDMDADGVGDSRAIDLVFITGAIAAGEDEEAILATIDQSDATGGTVVGLEVLATEGSANVYAVEAGALVGPVIQQSGVFADPDSATTTADGDVTTEFASAVLNATLFASDNDTIVIGDAAKFEEIEFILDTVASGGGVAPTFEYSTGVGTWTAFSPTDGTNGMRNGGVVAWLEADIPGWLTGTGSEYLIQITRTRNSVTTDAIEELVKIAATAVYHWNEDGEVSIAALDVGTDSPLAKTTIRGNAASVNPSWAVDDLTTFATINNNATTSKNRWLNICGNAAECQILFGDSGDADAGRFAYDNATDSFKVSTATALALTIDSSQSATFGADVLVPSGWIGVGTTPTKPFHLDSGATNLAVLLEADANKNSGISIQVGATVTGYIYTSGTAALDDLIIRSTAGSSGGISLWTADTERMYITPAGDITTTGQLTIGDLLTLTPKATAPATCTVAEDLYSDTSGALCWCSIANTWEQLNAVGSCA